NIRLILSFLLSFRGRKKSLRCFYKGMKRMAEEFHLFPERYQTNVGFLELQNDDDLSGVELLKTLYESMSE
ncbi:MAG: hypothetical protein MJ228_06150, partial [Bacilli bacterium]|nr:hypothetical protein [Bacilli bacterium]